MPVGATIAAVSSVATAGIGYAGAKSAAKTEANAARDAAAVQQQMYQQTREDLGGYRDFGSSALSPYAKLLGIGGGSTGSGSPLAGAFMQGGAAQTGTVEVGDPDYAAYVQSHPDLKAAWENDKNAQAWFGGDMAAWGKMHYEQGGGKAAGYSLPTASTYQAGPKSEQQTALEAIPGYQFMRDQGVQQVNRALGSRGLTGAQAKGIARFVTGLADSTYGEQVTRLNQAATLGENAAAGTGSIGAQYGSQIGGNIVGAGQAAAAGTVGAANAASAGIGSATNAYLANRMLGMYGGGGSGGVPAGGWSGG